MLFNSRTRFIYSVNYLCNFLYSCNISTHISGEIGEMLLLRRFTSCPPITFFMTLENYYIVS